MIILNIFLKTILSQFHLFSPFPPDQLLEGVLRDGRDGAPRDHQRPGGRGHGHRPLPGHALLLRRHGFQRGGQWTQEPVLHSEDAKEW